jgi:hypothetical protein
MQQYSDFSQLHPIFKQNCSSLQRTNPSYQYFFFDEKSRFEFLKSNFSKDIVDIYKKVHPKASVVRADLFKYLFAYKMGGVYLDVKSTVTGGVDRVIAPHDRFLLAHWPNEGKSKYEGFGLHPELTAYFRRGEIVQWFIISEPEHPYLKAVVDRVVDNLENYDSGRHGSGKDAIIRLTGPIAYTHAIAGVLTEKDHRYIEDTETAGIKYSCLGFESLPMMHEIFFKDHYAEALQDIPLLI